MHPRLSYVKYEHNRSSEQLARQSKAWVTAWTHQENKEVP